MLLSRGAKPDATAFSDYAERPVHCAAINPAPRPLLEALERYGANLAAVDQVITVFNSHSLPVYFLTFITRFKVNLLF